MKQVKLFLFFSILTALLWLVVATVAFHWMNQQSDLTLSGGVLLLLISGLIFPNIFVKLYRKYINPHIVQPTKEAQGESK